MRRLIFLAMSSREIRDSSRPSVTGDFSCLTVLHYCNGGFLLSEGKGTVNHRSLQAFPSFHSPTLLFRFLALAPFFARQKHRKSRFPTETLATQGKKQFTNGCYSRRTFQCRYFFNRIILAHLREYTSADISSIKILFCGISAHIDDSFTRPRSHAVSFYAVRFVFCFFIPPHTRGGFMYAYRVIYGYTTGVWTMYLGKKLKPESQQSYIVFINFCSCSIQPLKFQKHLS